MTRFTPRKNTPFGLSSLLSSTADRAGVKVKALNAEIAIENADNPPLEISSVKAEGNRYRMLFLASEGRRYRVEYGSDAAEAPRYDAAAVLASLRPGFQPVDARLGNQVENPQYRETRGPRDLLNNAIVLTVAIVLMVVVLGWILFRAGQRIKQLPNEEV